MSRSETLDRDVRAAIYRRFVDAGTAPSPGEIATELGVALPEVTTSLTRLADAHVITMALGGSYIWMANPFSALPTNFVVRATGTSWWGNCIWDALGILAALRTEGSVSTWCPDCGDALEVRIEGGRASSEADTVHFSVPAAQWWDDIGYT
ncbi:MAG: organomercurial lyase [Actinomycetota bacterium]